MIPRPPVLTTSAEWRQQIGVTDAHWEWAHSLPLEEVVYWCNEHRLTLCTSRAIMATRLAVDASSRWHQLMPDPPQASDLPQYYPTRHCHQEWRDRPGPWQGGPEEWHGTHRALRLSATRIYSGIWTGAVELPVEHIATIADPVQFGVQRHRMYRMLTAAPLDSIQDIGGVRHGTVDMGHLGQLIPALLGTSQHDPHAHYMGLPEVQTRLREIADVLMDETYPLSRPWGGAQ